jgi:hypothetical protein
MHSMIHEPAASNAMQLSRARPRPAAPYLSHPGISDRAGYDHRMLAGRSRAYSTALTAHARRAQRWGRRDLYF